MTPFEVVSSKYAYPERVGPNPFIPHPLQIGAINTLAPLDRQGEWMDMGTGKTFVATWCALYLLMKMGHPVLVIMPPILIRQWAKWLRLITPSPSIVEFRNSKRGKGKGAAQAERDALSLNADFILVGYQIFRKEFSRFAQHFAGRRFTLILDEAQHIGSLDAQIHDLVAELAIGQTPILLSGTPSDPVINAYGLIKFTAPGSYRNFKHFKAEHVDEYDFFKRPSKYCNLELLNQNLAKNSVRILFTDMYDSAQEPLVSLREYDLAEDHQRLYRKMADEQLLLMPDGGKLDLTSATRLVHALGQVIVNYGHFSGNEKHHSTTLDMIEEKMEQLGEHGKLLVFAHYKLSIAKLVSTFSKYGAVGINSEVTAAQKERNKERFIDDPKCRLIAVQYRSAALGLDGLQWVCNNGVMLEPPQQPYLIRQAIGRLQRGGQKYRVMFDIMIAERTLQVRAFKNLLNNDEIVNQTIRNKEDLRRMVYGE